MSTHKNRFQESMYFKEQHEYFLDLFSLDRDAFSVGESGKNIFEEGSIKDFRLKATGFLVTLFLLGFLLDIRLPGWLELVAIAAMCFLFVEGVIRAVTAFNEDSRKAAFSGMLKHFLILIAIIVVVGYAG